MKLEKIDFKNLQEPGLSEEILEALQDNIDKAINTKPIMKIAIPRQNVSTNGSYGTTIIPLGNTVINNDNEQEYFKRNNNSIVVGSEISLINVVAFTRGLAYNTASGEKEFILRKNEERAEGFYQRANNGYWGAIVSTVLQVNEGDRIDVLLQSQASGTTEILEGYLQVEAIK